MSEKVSWVTVVGGLGGLLSGGAAVAALFMAKPDLITVIVPVETLREVVVAAEARQPPPEVQQSEGENAGSSQIRAEQNLPPPSATTSQSLGGGLSATLASIGENPNSFVANLRITNDTDAQVMIAGRWVSMVQGDFSLSDAVGGSCHWRPDHTGGTLRTSNLPLPQNYQGNFQPVGSRQSAVVTVIFPKAYCTAPPATGQPLTLSGTFVVVENETPRLASASFENVPPGRVN